MTKKIGTKKQKILINMAQCLVCKTVLVSRTRHDFVSCPCGTFVDGGTDYLRRGGLLDEMVEMSVEV